MTSPTVQAMLDRYNYVVRLKVRVDAEIAALERGLILAGELDSPGPGRPRITDRLTEPEARELHRRYQRGERTEEAIEGERQYKRVMSRRRRERAKQQAREDVA